MENNKSIARTKKSVTTIAELLAKEGVSGVVPGGGLMYEATKALINHGKSYFSDRTASRIKDFHLALLKGGADHEKFEGFLKEPFVIDDYHAVLSSCVQDIEEEKVDIYSSLMRSLIGFKHEHGLRRHFIKSCKELTYSDLNFLKTLYINSKHDLMTVGGTQKQIEILLSTKVTLNILSIENLKSFGFVQTSRDAITPLADKFVNTIFSDDELLPESIGKKIFTGKKIVIVTYQLDDPAHYTLATEIQEALWSRQIKSSIQIIDEHRWEYSTILFGSALLLVGSKPIEPKYLSALSKFSKIRPIIKLNLGSNSSYKEVKDITFSDELNFKLDSDLSIKDIVFEYVDQLG